MIQAKNIVKKYPPKVTAVNDITYNFEKGSFYAIMGSSGSGKCTLLQILGTLDKQTSGNILIDDIDIKTAKANEISDIRISKIGFVFQSFNLHPFLTAVDNIMLPMFVNKKYKKSDYKTKAENLLELVSMTDRANHYPKQLSGGEQQRIAIARAIANEPEYILADEPTGNLDSKNEIAIFNLLKKLSDMGKTVIVVSHNEVVKEYADKILYMKDGSFEVRDDS